MNRAGLLPWRNPRVRRAARALERSARKLLTGLLGLMLPSPACSPPPPAREVRAVLVVRPNFRIGNTLMAAALVPALKKRYPDAVVDYLGGRGNAPLLEGLPLDRVRTIGRADLLRPWRLVALIRELRRRRYDLAVEASLESLSGGFLARLSGARHRLGGEGQGGRFCTICLPKPRLGHAYERSALIAGYLGSSCPPRPVYVLRAEEKGRAAAFLRELIPGGRLVGVFTGGHAKKRLEDGYWLRIVGRLCAAGLRPAVFLGPEERGQAPLLAREAPEAAVVGPSPLREFAAMVACLDLLVTPDSGPMHLAAATGVPVVAVLAVASSRFYAPGWEPNRVLVGASPEEVAAAVLLGTGLTPPSPPGPPTSA